MTSSPRIGILFGILFFFSVSPAFADAVTLAWDANVEPDLAGYKIYYKTGSPGAPYDGKGALEGDSPITIQTGQLSNPPTPQYTLHGLSEAEAYYFVVAAIDSEQHESGSSNKAVWVTTTEDNPIKITAISNDLINSSTINFIARPGNGTAEAKYSNQAIVRITVNPANDPPVAQDDHYNFVEGGSIEIDSAIGLLANDADKEGDSLTATSVSAPSKGTLVLNSDGSFTYTHTGSDNSDDSFTYMIDDGNGGTDTAVVSLTTAQRVTAGQLVLYTFEEGEGSTINDISGLGTPLDLTVEDEAAVSWLTGGGISINSSTVINSGSAATKIIEAAQASQEITIEAWVRPANTSQGGPARIVALSEDPYPNGGNFILGQDDHSYIARLRTTHTDQFGRPPLFTDPGLLTTDFTHVVCTRNVSGDVVLYVNGNQVAIERVGGDFSAWNESHLLSLGNEPTLDRPWLGELHLVAVFDRALDKVEVLQNFRARPPVTVTNEPPVAENDDYSVNEGDTLAVDAASGLLANDTDPDGGFLTARLVKGVSNGSLTLNPDGSFTYVHKESETFSDSFTYMADDGRTIPDIASVTITVISVNDPPIANVDFFSLAEGGTIDTETQGLPGVLANDLDIDGDSLKATLVSDVVNGTLDLKPNGSFTYIHNGSSTTSDSFTYLVDDENGGSDTTTVTFSITSGNQIPVAKKDTYAVDEGGALTVDAPNGVLVNDSDPEGGDLTAHINEGRGTSNGVLSLKPDGAFTYVHNGSETTEDSFLYISEEAMITYIPTGDFNGFDTFSYSIQHANSGESLTTVAIRVVPVNDAPVAGDDTTGTVENKDTDITLTAADVDGDVLNYTVSSPLHGTLSGIAPNLTYTPDTNYIGSDSFTFKVDDGQVDSNVATVSIVIETDSDGDGMGDNWEVGYFGDLTRDGTGDFDEDGLLDQDEYYYTTDPTDQDTDADGMPDGWEVRYGLDPLDADDYAYDPDGDGLTNLEEYVAKTNPLHCNPERPELLSPPDDESGVSLTPTLEIIEFIDDCSEPPDLHAETEWQISSSPDFSEPDLVLHIKSGIAYPSLIVPDFILSPATIYYWRAKFHDSGGGVSEWSNTSSFTTVLTDYSDQNGDGIPDDQKVDYQVDLDGNDKPDITQVDMKCVNTVVGGGQIGVKAISTNIVSVDSIRSIDPSTIPNGFNMPDEFTLGLVSFKVTVENAGEPATVAVYCSETLPSGAKYYKYDPFYGLREYPFATFGTAPNDNPYVILELRDGDPELGDFDGLANTFIVDPGGVGIPSAESSGGGGGGGGCFVATAASGSEMD